MKTPFLISCLLLSVVATQAQTGSVGASLSGITVVKGNNTGFQGVQSYNSADNANVKGSQFFDKEFQEGSVTTTNNERLTGLYKFLFDKVRQELFITSKSDTRPNPEVLLAEKQQIKSFTITTDRDHTFSAARNYDPTNTTDFYEVLQKDDSGYTLLKFVKTTFVKMDYRNMEKVKRGEFYDEFVDKVTYYVSYKSGKPQEISFKKKTMGNAFQADKKAAIDNYIDNHSNDDVNEQYLINLVNSANN